MLQSLCTGIDNVETQQKNGPILTGEININPQKSFMYANLILNPKVTSICQDLVTVATAAAAAKNTIRGKHHKYQIIPIPKEKAATPKDQLVPLPTVRMEWMLQMQRTQL